MTTVLRGEQAARFIKQAQKKISTIKRLRKELGHMGQLKAGKYNARGRRIDGVYLDSKAEADRYEQLKEMQAMGKIAELTVHPVYDLVVNGKLVCRYEADFKYRIKPGKMGSRVLVEDVKGKMTVVYAMKQKLMAICHPSVELIEIRLVRGSNKPGAWHKGVGRYRFLTADELHLAPKENTDVNGVVGRTVSQAGREGVQDRGDAGTGDAEGGEGQAAATKLAAGTE